MLTVRRDCEARLRARRHTRVAVPGETADRTATIPLWESNTGRSTEQDGGQTGHKPLRRGTGPVPGKSDLEFGRQIAVDLKADADLDKGRGRPGHRFLRRDSQSGLAARIVLNPKWSRN